MGSPIGPKLVLPAASALDTLSSEVLIQGQECLRASAVFGAGTTAGAVMLEYSPTPGYAGTWRSIGTMTWSAASKVEATPTTTSGEQRVAPGYYRLRISTAIVGGTVVGYIAAN